MTFCSIKLNQSIRKIVCLIIFSHCSSVSEVYKSPFKLAYPPFPTHTHTHTNTRVSTAALPPLHTYFQFFDTIFVVPQTFDFRQSIFFFQAHQKRTLLIKLRLIKTNCITQTKLNHNKTIVAKKKKCCLSSFDVCISHRIK